MTKVNLKRDRDPPPRMASRHPKRVGGRGSEGLSAGSHLADGQTSGYVVPGAGARLADGQTSGDVIPGAGDRLADGQISGDVVSGAGARLADGQISGDPDAPSGLRGEARVDVGQPWLPLAKGVVGMRPPGLLLAKAVVEMRPPGYPLAKARIKMRPPPATPTFPPLRNGSQTFLVQGGREGL